MMYIIFNIVLLSTFLHLLRVHGLNKLLQLQSISLFPKSIFIFDAQQPDMVNRHYHYHIMNLKN